MQNNTLHQLGIPQLSREQMVEEITERIRCARRWCQRHRSLLHDPNLHCRIKFQLYKFFVRPILTYGSELWTLDDRKSKKLLLFESSILLEIYKSKYPHRHPKRLRPNMREVYNRYRNENVVQHVNKERLRWIELLKIEEQALKRVHMTYEPLVHWWDESRPKTHSKPRKLTTGLNQGVSLRQLPTSGS